MFADNGPSQVVGEEAAISLPSPAAALSRQQSSAGTFLPFPSSSSPLTATGGTEQHAKTHLSHPEPSCEHFVQRKSFGCQQNPSSLNIPLLRRAKDKRRDIKLWCFRACCQRNSFAAQTWLPALHRYKPSFVCVWDKPRSATGWHRPSTTESTQPRKRSRLLHEVDLMPNNLRRGKQPKVHQHPAFWFSYAIRWHLSMGVTLFKVSLPSRQSNQVLLLEAARGELIPSSSAREGGQETAKASAYLCHGTGE